MERSADVFTEGLDDCSTLGVSREILIWTDSNDNASLKHWSVLSRHDIHVVRMESMTIVSRQEERVLDGCLVVFDSLVGDCTSWHHSIEDSLNDVLSEGSSGSHVSS